MTRANEIAVSVFDKDEIKNIRRMAIKVLDVLPDSVIEEMEEIDEYTTEGAILISKRAFEVLTDEELEEAGVNLDDFEDIREKLELVDDDRSEAEFVDAEADELSKKLGTRPDDL